MIKNLRIIKRNKTFKDLTVKDRRYKKFLKSRINILVSKKIAKEMVKFALAPDLNR